jgi:hypothetical protein
MALAEDPFSHMYDGSIEFNVAAFSTSFGRRIVAKINTNLNKPTISADRSWAYLNFGTSHKHRFFYATGASVTLITPQTFEHAHQNGKVGKKLEQHKISIRNARGGAMEITGVYTIYFPIDRRQMEAPFIVTREATSNIIGMNVIRTYKLKMDVLTTRVTASLAHVASLQTSEEYDVKVHTDIKVEAGMSHLTKLFLADKKSGKRLFGRHQFMVTVGQLAVSTVSDREGVFELLILNATRYDKDKIQAVKDITEQKTMKQLKSFIGLANYFRSYVKGFARVASDLHALTKRNTKWKEADGLPKRLKEAFEAIKAAISSRPVMAYPNNNGRFHLYVNAALSNSKDKGGLGAAQWQKERHGIKQVIGYASRIRNQKFKQQSTE